jgi:hypothetical protein
MRNRRFIIPIVLVLFLYSMYNVYFYCGDVVTTAPFTGHDDQINKLLLLGNLSTTDRQPHPLQLSTTDGQPHTLQRFMTMCTMVRNEAKYIREWVEFHSLLGVEKFMIFDNGSTDSLQEALNGTIADVHIIPWPPSVWSPENPHKEACQSYSDGKMHGDFAFGACQISAFHECLQHERGHSRWIACVDVDEFFMPVYDKSRLYTLPEVMMAYDHMHAVNWMPFVYGTNHRQLPIQADELLIQTHLLRREDGCINKEFADPAYADTYDSVHWAHYRHMQWNALIFKVIPRQRALVRYNHYPFKSVHEMRHKGVKNMNPRLYGQIETWDNADIFDPYMIPMVPLIRRRLAGERIWVSSAH